MAGADISVLLVDDHAVVREGYRRLLEVSADVHVCGEAADATLAYQRFCALRPDVGAISAAVVARRICSPATQPMPTRFATSRRRMKKW
jgi:DNA-binding NarL/FixJ family response regulator